MKTLALRPAAFCANRTDSPVNGADLSARCRCGHLAFTHHSEVGRCMHADCHCRVMKRRVLYEGCPNP